MGPFGVIIMHTYYILQIYYIYAIYYFHAYKCTYMYVYICNYPSNVIFEDNTL